MGETIPMKTTSRLLEKYNTFTQRPTLDTPEVRERIFRSLNRTLAPWIPRERTKRILDIGCGEGALLYYLTQLGFTSLAGFDLSPENVQLCHGLGLHFVREFDALNLNSFAETKFDVIFALDILEHLPKEKLSSFLEQVRHQLSPGGYTVIQTPNMGSVFATFVRYNDLTHEFGFTEKTIVNLLLTSGFSKEDIEVRPAWNATTLLGYLREIYLQIVHEVIFLAEDSGRPRIPTKNLLVRAITK
jgi:2-polyprenyl-3-methyl-5-hydroxy-6-metoxy-1,4-benzoquinol methylase